MNNIEISSGSDEEQTTNQGLIKIQQIEQEIIVDSSIGNTDQRDVEMDDDQSLKNIEKDQNEKKENESSNLERSHDKSSDQDTNNLMDDNSYSENNDNQNIFQSLIMKSNTDKTKHRDKDGWMSTEIPFRFSEVFRKAIIFETLRNYNDYDDKDIQDIESAFEIKSRGNRDMDEEV